LIGPALDESRLSLLIRVKEVLAMTDDRARDYINRKLATEDWVLLDVKIVEQSRPGENPSMELHHNYKVVYVIGRIK
jgi:hypothetical protein